MKHLIVFLCGLLLVGLLLLGDPSHVVLAEPSTAGDEFWDDRFFVGGPDNAVTMLGWYQNELIVGGTFRTAGKAVANHLAKWNGAEWQAIGNPPMAGICNYRCYLSGSVLNVNASLVYDGKLIVGGLFHKTILSWNGAQWEFFGGGLAGPTENPSGCVSSVDALAAMGDELFVGGCVYKPGTQDRTRLLRWDGANWTEVDGSATDNPYDSVHALVAQGEDLYVAGSFETIGGIEAGGIAKWNRATNQWSALGASSAHLNGIQHMVWYDGKLLIASLNRIQAWDGAQWSEFNDSANTSGQISELAVHDNELYVGGTLQSVNGVAVNNIAIWNGATWRGLDQPIQGRVKAMLFQNNELYVGGAFERAGAIQALNVAKWDGTTWRSLHTPNAQGIVGRVNAMVNDGTDVYVGGDFTWVGEARANGLAKWDTVSQTWTPLGNANCDTPACQLSVYALAFHNNTLYVGGQFLEIGGVPAKSLASWNGQHWSAFGDFGECCVYAIAVQDKRAYVSDKKAAIHEFDGSGWKKIGKPGGTSSPAVETLAFFDDELYVGGHFFNVNGVAANYVARWDGAAWHDAGMGLEEASSSAVNVLTARGKARYAGAWGGVFQWSGTRWRKLGEDSRYAKDIVSAQRKLFLSGESSSWTAVNGIAQRVDLDWQTLGSGIAYDYLYPQAYGGSASEMVAVGKQIIVGGGFSIVGNKPAENFAVWTDPAPPRAKLLKPANGSEIVSEQPVLKWQPADSATSYQVQLRAVERRGKLLMDTTVGETNVQTPTLKTARDYFWRVRGCHAGSCSAWSAWWQFHVK